MSESLSQEVADLGIKVMLVAAIVQAIESQRSPLRLLLGKAAQAGARKKVEFLRKVFETWADVTQAADFPAGQ